ncbi:MAG: hypothetical protein KAV87_50670 [Desulfobacteraceae bacterium]|nr:hypothetical protein [Desulfobacteraceae bacterium]
MQEVYQDGTMGETHIENTLEDLIPHIKKSLENQKVAYVKIYRGKTLVAGIKKPGTREVKKVVAIEEMKEKKI